MGSKGGFAREHSHRGARGREFKRLRNDLGPRIGAPYMHREWGHEWYRTDQARLTDCIQWKHNET